MGLKKSCQLSYQKYSIWVPALENAMRCQVKPVIRSLGILHRHPGESVVPVVVFVESGEKLCQSEKHTSALRSTQALADLEQVSEAVGRL
jgi:hypothetical protein